MESLWPDQNSQHAIFCFSGGEIGVQRLALVQSLPGQSQDQHRAVNPHGRAQGRRYALSLIFPYLRVGSV